MAIGWTHRLFLRPVLAGACALVAFSGAAYGETNADAAELRARFAAAYAAADPDFAAEDDAALRAYVLYPYLRAARVERALARVEHRWHDADAAALELVDELGTMPAGTALRRTWLASLARRGLWREFLDHYDPRAATAALECEHLNAQIAGEPGESVKAAIAERWLTPYRLPIECEPAFQWARAENALPEALVARRVELLLDNGEIAFARTVARRLPRATAAPLLERADFLDKPALMLDAFLAHGDRRVAADVVQEAWARLARANPDAALERFDALIDRAEGADASADLALALALGLAWDRNPEALDYFARVPAATFDDTAREWQARAAMWAGEWELVEGAIAALSEPRRAESAWRYWTARAADERGDEATARAAYGAVLETDNYYSAMAAARLGERVVPRHEPFPRDADQLEMLAGRAAFERARELALVGLRNLATLEWHYGFAELTEGERKQAIHLAAQLELYDVAVATATSYELFNDYELLYPRPYGTVVAAAAEQSDVDRFLLYGVLRQESLFRPDAASAAGALGVAQLTYETARATARRAALPIPRRTDLFDPRVNITLGAERLAELLARFDGQLPLALGAYNAGEAAAQRWLPDEPVDSDVWIENIPYNETRAYVRRVLWHSLVFAWLDTGRAQNTRSWVAKVRP